SAGAVKANQNRPVGGSRTGRSIIMISVLTGDQIMPLLDHFHPPLSQRRHWDSFHGAWAEAIAKQLNESLLPERYFAEARVKVGMGVEIDVGTFEEADEESVKTANGGVAVWAPPRPLAAVPVDFGAPDIFEVQVRNEEEGPQVVAAIEFVS